jgi:L-galactono-1,4-lactone dehydrogenase
VLLRRAVGDAAAIGTIARRAPAAAAAAASSSSSSSPRGLLLLLRAAHTAPLPPSESAARAGFRRLAALGLPLAMVGTLAYAFAYPDYDGGLAPRGGDATPRQVGRRGETVTNWSGTHEARPRLLYSPETEEDVEAIVREAHAHGGRKLRAVGGALSPNGLGLSGEGMVSLALLDRVLSFDAERGEVTVQAGARVQSVADHLRPLGWTLQNYASIREQHVAGFTQVSAHGTGARIPPADEQVVALRLVSPAKGTLDLRADASDPAERELFEMARCGLGCLGVVTRVTLRCVPAHRLVERTFVATPAEVARRHAGWLRSHRHLRYMWLPATDAVVVVQCDPVERGSRQERAAMKEEERAAAAERGGAAAPAAASSGPAGPSRHRLAPLRALLAEGAGGPGKLVAAVDPDDVGAMSLPELRDALVAMAPLDARWIARVNGAEAECWRRSAGVRVGWSDEILGFDCGGQQWVLEVAFPIGTLDDVRRECSAAAAGRSSAGGWGWFGGGGGKAAAAAADDDSDPVLAPLRAGSRDLRYMGELLELVRREGIPAPSPIEQRWTAGSASPMSPASRFGGTAGAGAKRDDGGGESEEEEDALWRSAAAAAASGASPADAVHSWVGVIMYLPTHDPAQREAITKAFRERYAGALVERRMMPRYGAAWHWAKIEPPQGAEDLARMRGALARRYPLDRFNAARAELDPKNVLGNALVDGLLGLPA